MSNVSALGELLSTLMEQRPFKSRAERSGTIDVLCHELLAENSEASGLQLSATILERFGAMNSEEQGAFFSFLNDAFDIDPKKIAELALEYKETQSTETFRALSRASEPKRQEFFRRLNQAPGATADLVNLRAKLIGKLKSNPELGRTDHDLTHLFKSWFNRGFLVLRQITWDTPASILERIIAYEAVHEIQNWADLRRRLQPMDRRCFAFFHPSMPDDPLIFVEVALTKGIPGSITDLLSEKREELATGDVNTAVFYSISNCQAGLAGISFGNSLIKQVVRDLSRELPSLKNFVTLSPIPGLSKWLHSEGIDTSTLDDTAIRQLAASYLLDAKRPNGRPLDPVARFHLGNGAQVHMVHANADNSKNGLAQSGGVMVNYLYDLSKIAHNLDQFTLQNEVAASTSMKSLARQAGKRLQQAK